MTFKSICIMKTIAHSEFRSYLKECEIILSVEYWGHLVYSEKTETRRDYASYWYENGGRDGRNSDKNRLGFCFSNTCTWTFDGVEPLMEMDLRCIWHQDHPCLHPLSGKWGTLFLPSSLRWRNEGERHLTIETQRSAFTFF